jgi:glutamyl-tRNA reductase
MNSTVRIAMVGCDHRHSSLSARERLAFTPEQTRDALAAWCIAHADHEAVLLSTCNRTELYSASTDPQAQIDRTSLAHFLAGFHNVPMNEIQSQLVALEGEEVVRHLFHVAASLDSMVLGEAQIVSQVKQAYELASESGSVGPVTHAAFQAAIRARRRIANETSLYSHRVSIPSVAIADFAARIFERFDDKRALVIGAGKMAQETLQYLTDVGVKQIVVLNRNFERADSLAKAWRGRPAPWNELNDHVAAADIVISTTGADRPIVTSYDYREHIARRRHQRPLFILDLAMPRDFDPQIGDELGVYLYGIDDLKEACERNRQARADELPAAEKILEEEVRTFVAEIRHRASVPVIARFRESMEGVQLAELERLYARMPDLDARSRQEIRQFADRLVAKMLHSPLESLRAESRNGSPHGLLDALQRLFQLKEKDNDQ